MQTPHPLTACSHWHREGVYEGTVGGGGGVGWGWVSQLSWTDLDLDLISGIYTCLCHRWTTYFTRS